MADWLASTATTPAPTEPAPHAPSRHSERRSNTSSSARNPVSKPPVFSVSKLPARWSGFFAIRRIRPPCGPPNQTANINRKNAPIWSPGALRGGESDFHHGGKPFMRAAAQLSPQQPGIRDDRQDQPDHRARGR